MTSNPIFKGKGYLFYFAIWLISACIYAFVLIQGQSVAQNVALTDAFISNPLFAVFGIGLWYVFYFNNQKNKSFTSILSTHLLTAIIVVFLWYDLSNYITTQLVGKEVFNNNFQNPKIWKMALGGSYYAVLILSFYLMDYTSKINSAKDKELHLQNALKQAELDMLKSQVNPHFLFNSLNSISSLTVSSPECAQEMVIKLSQFLRHSLNKDSRQLHELQSELNNLELYLDIEKIRFGERLMFNNKVKDICMKTKVPNLILQPLLENAIKHGLYESFEGIEINLECKELNDFLQLTMTNNYDPESPGRKGEGIGLKNTESRLRLIYGNDFRFGTSKENGIFKAVLEVPKQADYAN